MVVPDLIDLAVGACETVLEKVRKLREDDHHNENDGDDGHHNHGYQVTIALDTYSFTFCAEKKKVKGAAKREKVLFHEILSFRLLNDTANGVGQPKPEGI